MELVLAAMIVVFIICFVVNNYISKKDKDDIEGNQNKNESLPYKVTDSFLNHAEHSFYNYLKLYVDEKAVICPKVGLKDILFIKKGVGEDYIKYFGKIAQKQVDFLLCDPNTMKPICGIELDNSSHTNKINYDHNLFIEKICKDANFKLIRVSYELKYPHTEIETALASVFNRPINTPVVKSNNETILCPECSIPMVLRKVTKGANVNKKFYGCPNYPQCKEVIIKDV
ncbi:MAG: DUF2726 domain-containing protein [Dehalobacterium sp.]